MSANTTAEIKAVDPDYEYLVSIFGDFVLSESLLLAKEEYETAEIRDLHDAAWERFNQGGFRSLAHFANGPDYLVRVRLCRKLLQTRIQQSLGM